MISCKIAATESNQRCIEKWDVYLGLVGRLGDAIRKATSNGASEIIIWDHEYVEISHVGDGTTNPEVVLGIWDDAKNGRVVRIQYQTGYATLGLYGEVRSNIISVEPNNPRKDDQINLSTIMGIAHSAIGWALRSKNRALASLESELTEIHRDLGQLVAGWEPPHSVEITDGNRYQTPHYN